MPEITPNINGRAYNKILDNQNRRFQVPLSSLDFDSPEAWLDYNKENNLIQNVNSNGTTSGAGAGSGGSGGFNLHPTPTSGQGPFGAVPGQLGLPDPAGDLARQVPGLSNLNSAASSNILSKLNGTLSPGTLNALKNAQATYGVTSGMPGSGLSWNALYGNIAGAAEDQQREGLQAYNSFIPTVSGTQTVSPALQNEIASQNALNAAAPDPTQAASYSEQLFNKYLSQMRGGGNGAPPPPRTPESPAGSPPSGGRGYGGPQMGTIPPPTPYGDGTPKFLGSSSSFEDYSPPEWDLPISQPQGSYGVLAPQFDPGYQPYDSAVPDFNFDFQPFDDYEYYS